MPISITDNSRRNFLCQSLGLGASLLTYDLCRAAEISTDPHRVILLADTHIPSSRKTSARGQNMASNLEATVEEILNQSFRPAAVIINGDCAYLSGLKEDYQLIAELVKPLVDAKIPVHMTMGNHDDRKLFRKILGQSISTDSELQEKQVVVLKTPNLNLFLLDTLQIVNNVTGEVGATQRAWLQKALAMHADKPAMIVGHHNPQFDVPEGRKVGGIQDSAELFEILETTDHVKAYVYGHTHKWNIEKRESGLQMINQPPIGYAFNKKNPMGWLEMSTKPKEISLILHSKDKQHEAHGKTTQLVWR